MKVFLFGIIFMAVTLCAAAQQCPLKGKWQNIDDEDHSWLLTDKQITPHFQGKPLKGTDYSVSKTICDNNFKPQSKESLFIDWNGLCYEIVSCSENQLVVISTLTGSKMSFVKLGE